MAQKIIIIASNDEPTIAKLRSPLNLSGYDLETVGNGDVALDLIRRINPAAIVSELKLPQMDGMELCWLVRNQANLRYIPFLLLSSSADKEIELNSYRTGADAILIKPVSVRELLIRLEVLITRSLTRGLNGVSIASVFDGHLGEFMLLELIQWLHNNNKSGRMWLSNLYERGSILFEKGKIVSSRLGSLEGEEAIYQMFGWRSGKFEFETGGQAEMANIKKSTIEILLECSKRLDEKKLYETHPVHS